MAYINVVKLQRLFFRCHKILPLVYDESLSYYEVLCKVAASLNETIDAVNNLNDNVSNLNDRCNVMQEEIEEIAAEINNFEAEMTAKFDELEAKIYADVDAKLDEVDVRVDAIQAEVDSFKEQLESSLAQFEININKLISDQFQLIDEKFSSLESNLKAYIYSELQKILDQIPVITSVTVYDPTTGDLADIQIVVNHIYDAVRIYALSADEFDALSMTCDELDHIKVDGIPRGLTAYEWDMYAKLYIKQPDRNLVASYLSGELVKPVVNVDINNSLLKESGCYECSEFDSIGGTAETIDSLNITTFRWDWFSNNDYVVA